MVMSLVWSSDPLHLYLAWFSLTLLMSVEDILTLESSAEFIAPTLRQTTASVIRILT